jgi:hypothetical protein
LIPVHLNPDKVFFTGGDSTGEFCIHNLLNTIRTDLVLFGNKTARIKLLSTNNPKYDSFKLKLEQHLSSSVETNPKLKGLAVTIQDPENPNQLKRRLYVECGGSFTYNKQEIMNAALLQMSVNYVQLKYVGKDFKTPMEFAEAQYQPNVVAQNYRTLFSHFKSRAVNCFSLAKNINGKGACLSLFFILCVYLYFMRRLIILHFFVSLYLAVLPFLIPYSGGICAYWKDEFADTSKLIPNFGTTPNAATHEMLGIKRCAKHVMLIPIIHSSSWTQLGI